MAVDIDLTEYAAAKRAKFEIGHVSCLGEKTKRQSAITILTHHKQGGSVGKVPRVGCKVNMNALMVMRPILMRVGEKGCHGFLVAGCVVTHFATLADALVRLDMRAGRNLLQIERDRLGAFDAFEC